MYAVTLDGRRFLAKDAGALAQLVVLYGPREVGVDPSLNGAWSDLCRGPLGALIGGPPIPQLGPPDPAPRGVVVGLDVGGTDAKVVRLDRGRAVAQDEAPFAEGLARIPVERWFDVLAERLSRVMRRGEARAIGLSFPDRCAPDRVLAGLGSKFRPLRARFPDEAAFRAAFDTHVATLPERLAAAFAAPVLAMNDGVAAAGWVSARIGPSSLVFSLGTSVAGGSVDADGRACATPAYASALIGGEGGVPHRTTGESGTLMGLASQTALLPHLDGEAAKVALDRLLAEGDPRFLTAGAAVAGAARRVAEHLAFSRVVLLGRLVSPSPGAAMLLAAARAEGAEWVWPEAAAIPEPSGADPARFGQAVGAALLAAGALRDGGPMAGWT